MRDPIRLDLEHARVRCQFPGVRKQVYLDTSTWGLIPLEARDAVNRYLDARIDGVVQKDAMIETIENVRAKFAKLVHAHPDEIAFVKNVSEGVNAVIASIRWSQGDNAVICGDVDHPNCIYALYNVRDRYGVRVRFISAQDFTIPVASIISAMDERTRVVIAPSVPYTTGLRSDLKAIGSACRDRGVFFLVDGAQSVGALVLNAHADCIDGLAVGGSKYLCGPNGIGFLYVNRTWADKLRPAYLAWCGIEMDAAHVNKAGGEHYQLKRAARRFDIGNFNYAAANAMEVSLDLLLACGVHAIEQYILSLSFRFARAVQTLGLPLLARNARSHLSHVVVFSDRNEVFDSVHGLKSLYEYLESNNVKASLINERLRVAFHFYNNEEDIAQAVAVIRAWINQH